MIGGMKMERYEDLELEIIEFTLNDVILTSENNGDENPDPVFVDPV